jgi:hypothetical protein
MFIPPEQEEHYKALQRQAELHARRQRIREETGMDIADEDEEPQSIDSVTVQDEAQQQQQQQQILDQLLIEQQRQQQAMLPPGASIIRVPQQHLVGQPLSSSIAMMASGGGFIPVHMMQSGSSVQAGGGLVGFDPSMLQMIQQTSGGPIVMAMPSAALARAAQEEADAAEAEAMARQQQAAMQALIAAAQQQQQQQQLQQRELVQVVRLPSGQLAVMHMGPSATQAIPMSALRPAGIPLHSLPMHALGSAHPTQTLFHIPTSTGMIGLPSGMIGGVPMIAQQPQPMQQLVIGPNGTLLRLIR